MYIPNIYKNENISQIKEFISQNGFAIVVSQTNTKFAATHIPLQLDKDNNDEDVLIGHLSKQNPQALNIKDNDEVLVIFNGPHAYISSSWYQNEEVPTYNYIAVHIYGTIKTLSSEELMKSLKKLVDTYEQNIQNPVSVEKMSSKTLQQINGIVGFSINIKEIQAAYKLSQNRNKKDYQNIINQLESNENPNNIANEMKKLKEQ
jgi:transcriptional regulator